MGDLETKLRALRQSYLGKLAGKLNELRELLRRAPDDTEALRAAKAAAHKLHGTAGSYQLPAVSAAAATIERMLGEIEAARQPQTAWTEIERALEVAETARAEALDL